MRLLLDECVDERLQHLLVLNAIPSALIAIESIGFGQVVRTGR